MRNVIALLLGLASILPSAWSQEDGPNGAAPRALKICIIGASVSAGFGSNYDLAEVLTAALADSSEVVNAADTTFFLNVAGTGKNQIDQAIAAQPDLVIGIDYLFWFAAGKKSLEERLQDIDAGFAELDRTKTTVLIGLIPHMRKVSKRMLPESRQIPAAELPAINAHIRRAVAARSKFRIVPVDAWMDAIEDGEALEAFDRIGAVVEERDHYILPDGLHLNREGIIFAAALLIDDMSQKELQGRKFASRVGDIQKALAASERTVTIDVFNRESKAVNAGIIRFHLPTIAELSAAGFTLDELSKLKELSRYSEPLTFSGSNRVVIKNIPAAASKVQFRLRAEVGDDQISSWAAIDLEKIESRTILIVRSVEPLRIKILAGENANALPGAVVVAKEEAEGRSLRLKTLKGAGPGYGTTDAEGIATLAAVGPDAKTIVVRAPDGSTHEFARPMADDLMILRLPWVEAAEASEESGDEDQ